ncbi:MAG: hypothetical protein AB9869_11450 [Verrucomicrobiia bacterium]
MKTIPRISRRHFLAVSSALAARFILLPSTAAAASNGVLRRGFQTILLGHWSMPSVQRLAKLVKDNDTATAVACASFFLPAVSVTERFANIRRLALEVTSVKPLMTTEYFTFHAHDFCPDDELAHRARQFKKYAQDLLTTMQDRGIPRNRISFRICPMLEDNFPSEDVFRAKAKIILGQLPEALYDRIVIQRCGGAISAHRFPYKGYEFRFAREVHGPIDRHSAADSDVYSNDGGFVFIDKPLFTVSWNGRRYSVRESADSYKFEYDPPPACSMTQFKELIANERGRTIMLWRPQYNGRVLGVDRVRSDIVYWLENRAVPQQKLNIQGFDDKEERCAIRFLR